MRIVYVLTSLGMGGAERQVLALAERMAARGHTVALIVLRPRLSRKSGRPRLDVIHLDMRRTPVERLRRRDARATIPAEFPPGPGPQPQLPCESRSSIAWDFIPAHGVSPRCTTSMRAAGMRMLAYRLTDLLRADDGGEWGCCGALHRLKAVPTTNAWLSRTAIERRSSHPSRASALSEAK